MTPSFKDKDGAKLSVSTAIDKVFNRISQSLLEMETYILMIISWCPLWIVRYIAYRASGMRIGSDTIINFGARLYDPNNISIGSDCVIGEKITLDGRDALTIGDHVDIASEVMIYNSEHDIHSPTFAATSAPVSIGDYVFIGPRAIILPGVTVGSGAVIAAGAVVTRDVGENEIVAGVPAKPIGMRKSTQHSYHLRRLGISGLLRKMLH